MSRVVCLVLAFAALFVLTVHAAETKQSTSLRLFDEGNEQQQEQQQVQQSTPEETMAAKTTDTTDWPPLRLDFTVKSKAMNVFGHSNFSILANPVEAVHAANVLYDASATFTEGGMMHKYTLVDGIAYLSSRPVGDKKAPPTVECLNWENMEVLTLVNSIIGIINEAEPSSDSERSAECKTGNMFTALVAGCEFAVCASDSTGFTLRSGTMDVDVQYLEERANIATPKVNAGEEKGCEKVISAISATPTGKTMLTRSADAARN
ncbi:hypothetical protein PHYBOEH_005054 [Phytophthora boehmeriae]|uniref:Uncharacterized protein n=1 Tax=Phytophthora boehmeriae TaxID=109152 RepID=A0A8T1WS08_9STRA|nr:hypothetical protein PHYBOEH_005054 [Phytophthora boehmeriae]